MRNSTSSVLALALVGFAVASPAAEYFVAAEGADADSGSRERPWKTLAKLDSYDLSPGDVVRFRAGDRFTGGFRVTASGRRDAPITFTRYGSGPPPRLTSPKFASPLFGSVIRIEGDYVVVERLLFEDTPQAPDDPQNLSDKDVYRTGAVFIDDASEGAVVSDSEFLNTPLAVRVRGRGARITRNYVHDCARYLEAPYWGPIAFFIGGPDTEISYNLIENMIVRGGRFGADGGAFEIDDGINPGGPGEGSAADNVSIHHNISFGNAGFVEVEGSSYEKLVITHNFSDDYKWFVSFKGCFDCRVENNVAMRTKPRIGDAGHRFFDFPSGERYVVGNNILVTGSGVTVYHDEGAKTRIADRRDNRYFDADGRADGFVGLPLSGGDRIVSREEIEPVFEAQRRLGGRRTSSRSASAPIVGENGRLERLTLR